MQFANKDLQFSAKDGVQRATVDIYGRITTMTRRLVNVFEETVMVDSPQDFLAEYAKQRSIYQKTIPLIPGTYKLNVVAKDVVSGTVTDYEVAITVPRIDPDKLSSSSVVLADVIESVPMKSIGAGPFVIGSSKVRPRVDEVFKRDEKMGIYFQCYNFGEDETTHKPSGVVEYEVVKNGSNEQDLRLYGGTHPDPQRLRFGSDCPEASSAEDPGPGPVHHPAEGDGQECGTRFLPIRPSLR